MAASVVFLRNQIVNSYLRFELVLAACLSGLAIQQLLELLDAVLRPGAWESRKKTIFKLIAFGAGMLERVTGAAYLPHPGIVEVIVFGMMTAATAEIMNSLLKLLVYLKEARKAEAAKSLSAAGAFSLESVRRK